MGGRHPEGDRFHARHRRLYGAGMAGEAPVLCAGAAVPGGNELGAVHRPAGPHAVCAAARIRDRRVPHLRDRRFDGRRRHLGTAHGLPAADRRRHADLRLCGAVRGARGAPCAGLGLPRRRRPGRSGDGGVPFAARRRRRRHAHGGFEPALRGQPRRALHRVPGGVHGKGMGRAPARLVDGGLPRCGGARVDVLPDAPRPL